ncbi:SMP-30/gluconolactonase/LRE family protein [Loktanella sp. F6476L]|uniref:SMP-30/gluconolactonase/LRE family protein n=1 Tax=Loktanella sp. F6476L TaxID=2926405 RepID=UPI001FF2770B|nr:SMP-30/gluconolactonase/LRE family protein [Loktanella sp. F6476L]MCK0120476.1 SMP-30/gluconolactonase/LRE family protein [Loktanella sp. F6476L]
MIIDDTPCALGEGPIWHPECQQFFWFDILNKRLHTVGKYWEFDEYVSAAGWVDKDTFLIASATQLFTFDVETEEETYVCGLESDNAVTRSNDGRADPQGGFWIGTMGFNAEEKAGAIYRYYRGELRRLFDNVTITNAICFAPCGAIAYYTDTIVGKLMATDLDADGWPTGKPRLIVDLSDEDFGIDGAVVDADGNIWNAQWGASRVAQYAPDGTFLQAVTFPASQTSCPAFGGADLKTLYCTSATEGMTSPAIDDGKTFAVPTTTTGQAEHRVIL